MTGLQLFVTGALAGAALASLAFVVLLGGVLERLTACNRALAVSVARTCVQEMERAIEREGKELGREFRAGERDIP